MIRATLRIVFEELMGDPSSLIETSLEPKGRNGSGIFHFRAKVLACCLLRRMESLFLLAAILLWTGPLSALDPNSSLDRYGITSWGYESNLPSVILESVLQTSDGYLWLATAGGLVRFDGNQFVTFSKSNSGLPSNNVASLYEDAKHVLWIGFYESGVCKMQDKHFTCLGDADGLPRGSVRSITGDKQGGTWLAVVGAGLVRIKDGSIKRFTKQQGLASDSVTTLFTAADGVLWVGSYDAGASYLLNGRFHRIGKPTLPSNLVWSITQDQAGAMFLGTFEGLCKLKDASDERPTVYTERNGLPSSNTTNVHMDAQGTLWVTTDHGTLSRFQNKSFTSLSEEDGIADRSITALADDREGDLWLATKGGLTRLRDQRFGAIGKRQGLPSDAVRTVFQDHTGSVWLGLLDRMVSIPGLDNARSQPTVIQPCSPLAGYEDHEQTVWVGCAGGTILRYRSGVARRFPLSTNKKFIEVNALSETPDGHVVAATFGNGLVEWVDGAWKSHAIISGVDNFTSLLRTGAGLWIGSYRDGLSLLKSDGSIVSYAEHFKNKILFHINEDSDGTVWIDTDHGLGDIDGKSVQWLSLINTPLRDEGVYNILDDHNGAYWISSEHGIYRLDRRFLRERSEEQPHPNDLTPFRISEGVVAVNYQGFAQPSAARLKNGTLCFASSKGLLYVNPLQVAKQTEAPEPLVEAVFADEKQIEFSPLAEATIAPHTHQLRIVFTAIRLSQPEKLRFFYRMVGVDPTWVSAAGVRTVTFTDLPPRRYEFQIKASLGEDGEPGPPAVLVLRIQPAFYQTYWFKTICGAFLLLLIWLGYRWQIRRVRRIAVALEAVRTEEQRRAALRRTAELAMANEALQATADAIATLREMGEIVPAILKIIARTFEGPSAAYYEIGPDATIYLRYYLNEGTVITGAELLRGDGTPPYDLPKLLAAGFKVGGEYTGVRDYRQMKTRVIDHRVGTSEPAFDEWRRRHNREMELNVPLMVGGEPIGVLTLSREAERPYTAAEIELAEAVVKQFCLAVQASRIAEDSRANAVTMAVILEQEKAAQRAATDMAKANAELGLRNRLLSVVAEVSTHLAQVGDFAATLPDALGMIGEAGEFSRVSILEEMRHPDHDQDADHFLMVEWCARGVPAYAERGTTTVALGVARTLIATLRSGEAFWSRTQDLVCPLKDVFSRMDTKAIGFAPLLLDGVYWGNVMFEDCGRENPWDPAHVDALTAIAQAISNGLQTRRDAERLAAQREQAAKERANELAALNETITASFRRIASEADTLSAPPIFLADIARAASANLCYWLDYDDLTEEFMLSLRCKDGVVIERPDTDEPDFFSSPFSARMLASFLTPSDPFQFQVLDVERDADRLWPATAEWHRKAGRKQVLCFAVGLGDRAIGMLGMAFREELAWTPPRIELIRSLANHLALSIYLSRLSRQASRGAAMEERTRLAREIHDTLAQGFSGILVQLRAMQQAGDSRNETARTLHFENALELANGGLAEARRSLASLRLRELEGRSFREALALMAQSATKQWGIPIRVVAGADVDIGPENEAELLRIAQESVTNALKHSGASEILIALRLRSETIDLCIEDNGRGFDPARATEGFGLLGMQERAAKIGATMTIESSGKGTSVCVHLKRGGNNARF